MDYNKIVIKLKKKKIIDLAKIEMKFQFKIIKRI